MASDRQKFNRAYDKWDQLKRAGDFSKPAHLGKVAIISSPFTDEPPDTITGMSELASFRGEAYALADRMSQANITPEIAIDATEHDITRMIQDPEIASMYVIGNGSLSSLLLGVKKYYDWEMVSAATTHLKLGVAHQRQCGNLSRATNVPFGLFMVHDPRNVYAAVGDQFYPQSLDDIENEKIQPVFTTGTVNYESVKNLRSAKIPGEF